MELSAESIWGAARAQLSPRLSVETFNLWFAPLSARVLDHERLVLEVANEFFGMWLKDNYLGLLQEAVDAAAGRRLDIHFEVGTSRVLAQELPPQPDAPQEFIDSSPEPTKASQGLKFDPRNTFETFVVGSNNNFAHAAALAVAQSPAKAYNPLFVYGGAGLGKTHLLNAIGNHVASKKGAHILYMSSEQFTNVYIEAVQNNQLGAFRKKSRQADVLLIDDVQFLMGKERIQEEFFHTFNALHEARKQIVLTCDRPAGALQNLEKKLVSRFEWGLVTDLQPPDSEMRLAILRKKAALLSVELPDEIMSFLANRIRTNIRRLEGAFNRVASYCTLTGHELSLEVVESLLREVLHEEGHRAISIEAIQKKVAEHFDIRLADMTGKRRPENIAFPRQIAMFFSRRMTGNSLSAIGEAFGGRDHGTVLHACRLVEDRMEVDSHIRHVIGQLEMELSN